MSGRDWNPIPRVDYALPPSSNQFEPSKFLRANLPVTVAKPPVSMYMPHRRTNVVAVNSSKERGTVSALSNLEILKTEQDEPRLNSSGGGGGY